MGLERLREKAGIGVSVLRVESGNVVVDGRHDRHRDLCLQKGIVELAVRPLQILSDERHHGLLDLHVFLLFHRKLLVSLLRAVKDWPELRLAPRFGRLLSEKGGLRHWKRKVGSKSVPGSLPGC